MADISDVILTYKDDINSMTFYKGDGFYVAILDDTLPSTLSIEDTFRLQCIYIFCRLQPEEEVTFYEEFSKFLEKGSRKIGFLWILNPTKPFHRWNMHKIVFFNKQSDRWDLIQHSSIVFFPYRIMLSGNMYVQYEGGTFLFQSDHGSKQAIIRLNSINGVISSNQLRIHVETGKAGILSCNLEVDGAGADDIFERMDACIKYTSRCTNDNQRPWRQGNIDMVSSYFLRSEKDALPVRLSVNIDLLDIADPQKTYLKLSEDQTFESTLLNVYGHKKRIKTGSDSFLVFEKVPSYIHKNKSSGNAMAKTRYYLSFSGSYHIIDYKDQILCGLSGTEFIDMTASDNDLIHCVANQPSYLDECGFGDLSTTAWFSFPANASYYSQPETAPLFHENETDHLHVLEIPTTYLEDDGKVVPILFYQGCRSTYASHDALLQQEKCIYACRHDNITNQNSRNRIVAAQEIVTDRMTTVRSQEIDTDLVTIVTAQGLTAEVKKSNGKFTWLGIARSDEDFTLPNLRYVHIQDSFRLEFLNSHVFILKDKKEDFLNEASTSMDFFVEIEYWRFLLATKDWRSNGNLNDTIMIMKYVTKESILDRIPDSMILKESIRRAEDSDGNVLPQYEDFMQTLSDPDFQGIVFLNVAVSVDHLPREISILLQDIDQKKFYAHHVILTKNKVVLDDQFHLRMEKSAIHAVIDYQNVEHMIDEETMPNYAFTTVKVGVTVNNSKITSFTSESEIFIKSLFGTDCHKESTISGNAMILDGSSQMKDDQTEYIYKLREPGVYQLTNSGFDKIQFDEVTFLVEQNQGDMGCLSFQGKIECHELTECDLLSYAKLQFSNLQLIMPRQGSIYMNYKEITYQEQGSELRTQSFMNRYAASFDTVIYQEEGSPDDLNYRSITCPVNQSSLTTSWTGMIFSIPLGGLGGLASTGDVSIKLMTAFSSTKEKCSYYVGISTPSLLSGFDLQGIMKLGFQSIDLLVSKKEQNVYYTLRLHNYALHILGADFPPGVNDLYLFADQNKLGWYAAYKGEDA